MVTELLSGSRCLTRLDLRIGCQATPIHEEDKRKTAFTCRHDRQRYRCMITPKAEVQGDLEKRNATKEWPIPKNLRQLQQIIGFAKERFTRVWLKMCKGMNNLKDVIWQRNKTTRKSFELLKAQFEGASILVYANQRRQFLTEADMSDFNIGGGLLQEGIDENIHPRPFYSKTMQPAKRDVNRNDKELLAIVQCLKEWRHLLRGAVEQSKIIMDHENLGWFLTTKQLLRRQADWAEFLAEFDLGKVYRPDQESGKPDALLREPDHEPQDTQEREYRIFTKRHLAMAINFV